MTLTAGFLAFTCLVSFTTSAKIPFKTSATQETFQLPSNRDSYEVYHPQLPLNIELPRIEINPVSFYPQEPASYVQVPSKGQEPNYYQAPLPSQDLVAPSKEQWNPNNDPELYYEVPALLTNTKQELPTRVFPKKFSKEIHVKSKPFSSKPKQEVVLLEPITDQQFEVKQKELGKVFKALAKKENLKLINDEKVQKKLKNRLESLKKIKNKTNDDSETSGSYVEEEKSSDNYDRGLNSEITSSLGIPSSSATDSSSSSPGERLMFHMVGHDGPHSYKWGFDTGKGHNRQFRFEERDKSGVVKGHYGYYNEDGKLQVVHYDSHPHLGFHVSDGPKKE